MAQTSSYRNLTQDEIQALAGQGCTADDWAAVRVAQPFDVSRVRNAHFSGKVEIGPVDGFVTTEVGLKKPAGIYNAYVANCTIGRHTRIANIGVHVAHYDIGDGVCIEGVGSMHTRPGATFGNGVEIEVLNEGGGREVVLFNELSSQFAHLLCLHRYRPNLTQKLTQMAQAAAAKAKSDRGKIGTGARISSVAQILDVNVGDHATVSGAALLVNGTILSSQDAPTTVGADVQAEHFIIAEGSQVSGGAIVSKTYIGQGCQIGKQFSAEGSVFFANGEGFHGEACSVFAGPYTVTHHKSTLLIAGLFSFYNAGSGTNQSNHMYKLGPVHEGKLERGSKTGSFAYMMWPCRVGPFSVVLGKHTGTFDTSDLPFSLIEASPTGRCRLIPGLTLSTVGTVRDGAKWPARDRRKGKVKRDRISFDVFSPMTVGRMLRGSARLKELQDNTDRAIDAVTIDGAEIRRVLLRTGQKFYQAGIHMYLLEKVVSRLEEARDSGSATGGGLWAVAPDAVFSQDWVDIGGQMMPRQRLDDLCEAVSSGQIQDLAALETRLDKIHAAYARDEWVWVKNAYKQVFGTDIESIGGDEIGNLAESLRTVKGKFLKQILNDAAKEFHEVTRTGFGQDGTAQDATADFLAVRGAYEANKFVKQMQDDIAALDRRVDQLRGAATSA